MNKHVFPRANFSLKIDKISASSDEEEK